MRSAPKNRVLKFVSPTKSILKPPWTSWKFESASPSEAISGKIARSRTTSSVGHRKTFRATRGLSPLVRVGRVLRAAVATGPGLREDRTLRV